MHTVCFVFFVNSRYGGVSIPSGELFQPFRVSDGSASVSEVNGEGHLDGDVAGVALRVERINNQVRSLETVDLAPGQMGCFVDHGQVVDFLLRYVPHPPETHGRGNCGWIL